MRELGMQSFDIFLHSFEGMIIRTLVERNQTELEKGKKPLVSGEELLKVLFRFYDQSLFE